MRVRGVGVLVHTELSLEKIIESAGLWEVTAESGAAVCGEEVSYPSISQICFTVDLSIAANDGVSEDVAVIPSHSLQVTD